MEREIAPVYQSVIRPILFMGGDRILTMLAGLFCAAAVFAVQTWFSVGMGLVVWSIALYFLRIAAKADPLLRDVYPRQIKYKAYYPARSTPWHCNFKSWKLGRKGWAKGWRL